MRSEKESVAFHSPHDYRQQGDGCLSMGEVRHVRIPTVGRTKRMDASVGYLIAYLALPGCTREQTWRRLLGWFGTRRSRSSSDDRDPTGAALDRRHSRILGF